MHPSIVQELALQHIHELQAQRQADLHRDGHRHHPIRSRAMQLWAGLAGHREATPAVPDAARRAPAVARSESTRSHADATAAAGGAGPVGCVG